MSRLRRAPIVRIYDVRDTMVMLAPDGSVQELRGPSAELARELLSFCASARTRAELLAHVEALTGTPLADTTVVDELLALLERNRVLVPVSDASEPRPQDTPPRTRLLLGLCGAVACSLAPGLIAALQTRGFELRVVATASALRFVQAMAIEALIHDRVHTSLWPREAEAEPDTDAPTLPVPHINLAQWADAVLIWPATATTISRLATGDYSSLVSAIALTTRAPVVVVPSMNVDMHGAAAVQRNLRQLVDDGMHVVHAGSGRELADAPGERSAGFGPAPPHAVVIELLETALKVARARRTHERAGAPRDAQEWDQLFRSRRDHELGWHVETLDDDLLALLQRELDASKSLLDVGTGLGVAAIAAARLGARVVATDVSETALARAAQRAGDAPIIWLRDDITASRLHGRFDVILDRGCLHLLAPAQQHAYAHTLARVCAPGGLALIKTHAPSEGSSRQTTPCDAASIERLLGFAFTLESDSPSCMPGPEAAPAARLFVLRRTPPPKPPATRDPGD